MGELRQFLPWGRQLSATSQFLVCFGKNNRIRSNQSHDRHELGKLMVSRRFNRELFELAEI